MAEPTRCRFCDMPTEGGAYCDSGCRAGFTLFMPPDEDDEDEPTPEACDTLALDYQHRRETHR